MILIAMLIACNSKTIEPKIKKNCVPVAFGEMLYRCEFQEEVCYLKVNIPNDSISCFERKEKK